MKKLNVVHWLFALSIISVSAQIDPKLPASKVDFDAFEQLTKEVNEYRKDRLLNLDDFLKYAQDSNTIILDTRSTEMYNRKHVKGAVHLDFIDFTQANLDRLIQSTEKRILIYCNNNFENDEIRFATKMYVPMVKKEKQLTLALNIPTFINLYGYGYRNVYELADLVSVYNSKIEFEGTDVIKIK